MKGYDKRFEGISASFLILGSAVVVRGGRWLGSPASTQVAFKLLPREYGGWVGGWVIRASDFNIRSWVQDGFKRWQEANSILSLFWIFPARAMPHCTYDYKTSSFQ